MKIFKILFFSSFLYSCGSYVDSLHRQIDRESGVKQRPTKAHNQFDLYRGKGERNNNTNLLSTANQKAMEPNIKRQYNPDTEVKKRYTSDDLYDNGNEQSLWSGQGKDSFLFTQDSKKRQGDIILINVMNRLKNDITAELKRVFPAPQAITSKKDKKGNAKDGKKDESSKEKESEEKDNQDASSPAEGQVHDKISTVIIEEINKDHVLLSGRKNILFRNRKHLIEVQALAHRRNINTEDQINSDEVIETNISVLR